ncbi:MAG: double-strand break repair helicase AddA [Pseudomonadota bacterium]
MTVLNAATIAQMRAADPAQSTWLSANAGSGKTRVLTDRVARLLLHGVEPQRILCLTYTKAAATEMQNRLFKRLGDWAMMPDAGLRAALAALGEGDALDAGRLGHARQLFARAIDTPGGLRIQTIHSFCAMLLRRFPLEAGVSPQFTEMDDRAGQMLRDDLLEAMADGPDGPLVARLAGIVAEGNLPGLIQQITGRRSSFSAPVLRDTLLARFDLPPGFDEQALMTEVFLGGEAGLIGEIVETTTRLGKGLRERDILKAVDFSAPSLAALRALERTLLRQGDGAKGAAGEARIGDFPVKDARTRLADRMPRIEGLMRRVEAAMPRRLALNAVDRTIVLHDFARAFFDRYAAAKAMRGWLDFDDLIQHAKRLLTEPGLAAWVLYRLDGGIDHVLVDEAQDTSPDQWHVIQSLTDEFFVGQSRARDDRTVFVVGDKKQSIYSFQGADVAAFDRMQDHFQARSSAVGRALVPGQLRHSFRSSQNILRLVDLVFQGDARAALGGDVAHVSFHEDQPGRIDLWPVVPSSADPKDQNPFDPVDIVGEASAQATLATQIATEISSLLAAGTQICVGGAVRPVHAGDFLILVQRRSTLFGEIIRACKKADLPIAGSDRLRLGAEIAVKDLAALLAFLATPEDDLSLATVLRSPLCGLSESQLYALAQPRKGYLWQALREAGDGFAAVNAMLADLMAQADFLRPYELIERVLTRHDGRRRLLARLGPEAEDGIDELLQQALAHERRDIPSLTSFLVALQTDDVEVKRQADGAGRRIRVMTVHGAKGLEAPVVILPDTADRAPNDRDRLVRMKDGTVLDRPPASDLPRALKEARAKKAVQDEEERLRLLYVAMTRAQSWLIVAAAGTVSQPQAWYAMLAQGMRLLGPNVALSGGRQRHEFGIWPASLGIAEVLDAPVVVLPDWVHGPAPVPTPATEQMSPSALGGAKALPGELGLEADLAKAQGTALHLLLEHLPDAAPADRPALAAALVPQDDLRAAVLPQVTAILADDGLHHLFGPESMAEAALTADLGGRRMTGTVDRLVVTRDQVLAVDFKSNRVVPDSPERVPDGILAQMGAYARALQQIYPDRQVAVAVLWTSVPHLMPLDLDIVRRALATATKA